MSDESKLDLALAASDYPEAEKRAMLEALAAMQS